MSDPLLYSYKRYVLVVVRELIPLTSSIELPAEYGAINGSYGLRFQLVDATPNLSL